MRPDTPPRRTAPPSQGGRPRVTTAAVTCGAARVAAALLVATLGGCGSPPRPASPLAVTVAVLPDWDPGAIDAGHEIARAARTAVGASYRYGGATRRGFDCSGLVYRTYLDHGIRLPRTVRQLLRAGRPVSSVSQLAPGDLVFFRLGGRRVSHVGLYLGDGEFVHASSGRRQVVVDDLDGSAYFRDRLVSARRIVPLATAP
ncbi:MAG: C40 family peptidase [Candidatus Eiseniibacteriota bacterium]|jgi:cell wall-associated NlpC family hydrolase